MSPEYSIWIGASDKRVAWAGWCHTGLIKAITHARERASPSVRAGKTHSRRLEVNLGQTVLSLHYQRSCRIVESELGCNQSAFTSGVRGFRLAVGTLSGSQATLNEVYTKQNNQMRFDEEQPANQQGVCRNRDLRRESGHRKGR